jgi:hypothetical protein
MCARCTKTTRIAAAAAAAAAAVSNNSSVGREIPELVEVTPPPRQYMALHPSASAAIQAQLMVASRAALSEPVDIDELSDD